MIALAIAQSLIATHNQDTYAIDVATQAATMVAQNALPTVVQDLAPRHDTSWWWAIHSGGWVAQFDRASGTIGPSGSGIFLPSSRVLACDPHNPDWVIVCRGLAGTISEIWGMHVSGQQKLFLPTITGDLYGIAVEPDGTIWAYNGGTGLLPEPQYGLARLELDFGSNSLVYTDLPESQNLAVRGVFWSEDDRTLYGYGSAIFEIDQTTGAHSAPWWPQSGPAYYDSMAAVWEPISTEYQPGAVRVDIWERGLIAAWPLASGTSCWLLTSPAQGWHVMPGGYSGILVLGAPIQRLELAYVGHDGAARASIGQPPAGTTLHFQAWYDPGAFSAASTAAWQ